MTTAQAEKTLISDEPLNEIEIIVGDTEFFVYTQQNESELRDKVKAFVKGDLRVQPDNKPVVALITAPNRGPGRPSKHHKV